MEGIEGFKKDLEKSVSAFDGLIGEYERRFAAMTPGSVQPSESPANAVSAFLNGKDGFAAYTNALQFLNGYDSDAEVHGLSCQLSNGFERLGEIVVREWARFGRKPEREFRRTVLILQSVFKPDAFVGKPNVSVYGDDLTGGNYRQMALDRVAYALRDVLVWLRDSTRRIERDR